MQGPLSSRLRTLAACFAAASTVLAAAACMPGCASTDGEDEPAEDDLGSLPNTPIYASSRTQSPLTAAVASRLHALAGNARPNVFAKIGDSQTVNSGFMKCFAGSSVDLANHEDLDETRRFFLGPSGNGSLTFSRTSRSAKVGAFASFALGGPLASELAAISPRYAVVMYGTNDIQNAPSSGLSTYAKNMKAIIDTLLKNGVVPILTSPPPRPLRQEDLRAFGPAGADIWAPRFATVVRGIAQGRQIPFVDLQRELRTLPDFGIGSDNLHLVAAPAGACHFDAASMKFGLNVRNLVTLEALSRARTARESGIGSEIAEGMRGSGTARAPYIVPEFPFSDLRSFRESSEIGGGAICNSNNAARFTYRAHVTSTKNVYFGLHGVANSVLYVRGTAPNAPCRAVPKNDGMLKLDPGDYDLIVARAASSTGEYLLTATAD